MPNDAGAVDATPTRKVVHLVYIDSDGKPRTDSYDIPVDVLDADLNALSAAVGAITNASLWQIGYTNWFATGLPSKENADDSTNDSVMDNLVILLKTLTSPVGFDFFVPANLEGTSMVLGTENPDPLTAEMVALVDALELVWPAYQPISYRFSERRKKNRAIKA